MQQFEVRWSNGVWRCFDTLAYTTDAIFGLQSFAQDYVNKRNKAAQG